MSAKHSCKNTEYETFDFGPSGPNRTPTQKGKMNTKEIGRKQDPNAEGNNDHKKIRENNMDLSRSMIKKGAKQLFPISDPYPAGTKR